MTEYVNSELTTENLYEALAHFAFVQKEKGFDKVNQSIGLMHVWDMVLDEVYKDE